MFSSNAIMLKIMKKDNFCSVFVFNLNACFSYPNLLSHTASVIKKFGVFTSGFVLVRNIAVRTFLTLPTVK